VAHIRVQRWAVCEHGKETLDFMKGGEFLEQNITNQLLKKNPVPCAS
jgi:hypothetical protein